MKLLLEKISYRLGEIHLKTRTEIAHEIDEMLLKPMINIANLSRNEYVELLRAILLAKGWEKSPPVYDSHNRPMSSVELFKDSIGLQIGLRQTSSLVMDMLKFQVAHLSVSPKIDLGVYITGTADFQRSLRKESEKPWTGLNFHVAERQLPSVRPLVTVPVCIIGIDRVIETDISRTLDLIDMSPAQIKELVFEFLERQYSKPVDRDVSVIGEGADIGFDGIIRFDDADMIFTIELSKGGSVMRSKVLSDDTRSFANRVFAYQNSTGRKARLRFVLIGNFSAAYVDSIVGSNRIAYGWAEDIDVDYEIHTFEEVGVLDPHPV